MSKYILLSFDAEEFDVPLEYGEKIKPSVQFDVSLAGLRNVISLLEYLQIKATFFVTANFALHHPELIESIAKTHEIASHGFYHSQFSQEDLWKSKQVLEEISGKTVSGFRMARLQPVDEHAILASGYQYNSSLNPTYLPGRYNNFFKPRTVYYQDHLLNLPVSVTPLIRFPLFWLSFKNLPLPLIQLASRVTLDCDRYLSLYFHPWEFTDISKFKIPNYMKRHSGIQLINRLEKYLSWLKQQGEFTTISDWIKHHQS